MRRYSGPKLLVILLVAWWQGAAACGSVAQHFFGYPASGTLEQKQSFLEQTPCSMSEAYSPENAEEWVAKALINAKAAGVTDAVINRLLSEYNCVHDLKGTKLYKRLRREIGADQFDSRCDLEQLARMYVVVPKSGVVLRSGPSRDSKRMAAIAHGALVRNGSVVGDWVEVETYRGRGYIHRSLLRQYGVMK